jgi:hypothetical protein
VRQLIRSAGGAKLFFLPKYSPDLNPHRTGLCSSNICSARRRRAHSGQSASPSASSFRPSNAPTTSQTQATDALEHLLADSVDLAADYAFIDSWFESGDAVDAVLVGNRQAPHKRAALVMEKVLEPRREWWTQVAGLGSLHLVSGWK